MNIAIIKHNPNDPVCHEYLYLFSVPEGVKLKAGDIVRCKTRHGEAFGWLAYDSFEAEGTALKAISDAYGASELKPIIGVYELSEFEDGTVQELDADSVRGKEITIIGELRVTEIVRPEDWEHIGAGTISAKNVVKGLKQHFDDVEILSTKFFVRDAK